MRSKIRLFCIFFSALVIFPSSANAKIKSYYFTKDYMVVSGRYNLPKADVKCSSNMILNEVNVSSEFLLEALADRDQFSNALSEAFNKSLDNYDYKSNAIDAEKNNYLRIDLKDPVIIKNDDNFSIKLSAVISSKNEKHNISHSVNSSHSIYVYKKHGKASSVAVGAAEFIGIAGIRQATAKDKPKYPIYEPNSMAAWEGNGTSYFESNDERLIINVGIERSLQNMIANYIYKLSTNTAC